MKKTMIKLKTMNLPEKIANRIIKIRKRKTGNISSRSRARRLRKISREKIAKMASQDKIDNNLIRKKARLRLNLS